MLRCWVSLLMIAFFQLVHMPEASLRNRPRYTEEERMAEYIKRGYTFPFEKFNPDTEGWNRLMNQRVSQLMAYVLYSCNCYLSCCTFLIVFLLFCLFHTHNRNPEMQERWDGWIQTLSSAITTPNYTEFGWGLTHAPDELTETLRQAIHDGLPTARTEGKIDVITGPNVPLFVDRPDLTSRVSNCNL